MKRSKDDILGIMREANENAMLAEGFEDAFLGPAVRCGQQPLAAYSYERAVQVLIARDGMTREEATEWMDFNVVGAWVGPGTPIWIYEPQDDND